MLRQGFYPAVFMASLDQKLRLNVRALRYNVWDLIKVRKNCCCNEIPTCDSMNCKQLNVTQLLGHLRSSYIEHLQETVTLSGVLMITKLLLSPSLYFGKITFHIVTKGRHELSLRCCWNEKARIKLIKIFPKLKHMLTEQKGGWHNSGGGGTDPSMGRCK